MNGIFKENRSGLRHLLLWSCLALTYLLLLNYGDTSPTLSYLIAAIMTMLTTGVLYLVHYRLIPKYLQYKNAWRFVLYLFTALLFVSILLFTVLISIVGLLPGMTYMDLPNPVLGAPFLVIFMWLITISFSMMLFWRKQQEHQLAHEQNLRKLAESEEALKKVELAQLQSQLNPHFLFNTLNTLYGAALKKADHTAEMILELSELLNYNLYQASKDKVPLAEEIRHIERYVGLEQKRFRDGLEVNFTKSGPVELASISPLLFLPFVENAFKHGSMKNGTLTLDMNLSLSENHLDFYLCNTAKLEVKQEGIGLKNVRKRLETLYPNQHKLLIERKEDTFEVRLLLTLKPLAS